MAVIDLDNEFLELFYSITDLSVLVNEELSVFVLFGTKLLKSY